MLFDYRLIGCLFLLALYWAIAGGTTAAHAGPIVTSGPNYKSPEQAYVEGYSTSLAEIRTGQPRVGVLGLNRTSEGIAQDSRLDNRLRGIGINWLARGRVSCQLTADQGYAPSAACLSSVSDLRRDLALAGYGVAVAAGSAGGRQRVTE